MKVDKYVEGYILSTCNALGSEINGVYEKGKDCIECLKDILRYLKRDDDDNNILRFLGSIRLLQTDLLPIIKRHNKDKEVFDFTLRILIALTNPALLLYKEDVPDDKLSRNVYLQIVSYLQEYKKAFNDADVWKILYEHLKDLLQIRPIERSNDEKLYIERIIILTRNVLHVPSDESVLKQTDNDLSIHDKILKCLHESKLNILILYLSANEEEHSYCLHVIEIVSLMFREHTAETLANSNETRSAAEKEKDLSELRIARMREQNMKMQKIQSTLASRFRGVYQVKNMKSISDNDYICHKLIKNVDEIKFDINKNARRKPKNKVRPADVDNSRQSTLSIRLLLKKFCIEFLKSYNKLLVSVKRELLRQVSDEHDDTYYLWAISYFMQFNRLYDFQPALVSETISIQSFHHIQTQITNYQEMMLSDKKKTNFWARRMQLGISTYKELLETLKMMCTSPDEVIKESADALISHVFYVIEYREMLLSLLSNYNEAKFPLSYLAELVESAQLFLKMLENHSKQHSEIIVQKKQKKIHRKKKKKPAVPAEPVNVEDQLKTQWEAISSELSATVEGLRTIPNVTPFDGASDISFEEQKVEAVYKIREALVANEPLQAVGLLRAARELWPEGDSFGATNIEHEPELLVLKEIHFSNLQRNPKENVVAEVEGSDSNEDEEDEEAEALPAVTEQKLDIISDVYRKYASPKVVQPCSLLLANYRNNKPQTNMCLIKLLHRIAWNCKMHALFFQSTIFVTFQKIFHDPDVNIDPVIKEFYRFSRFIMQKFFAAAEKNEKIYVELLFWKGTREAYELEEGYGASENKKREWTEEDEEELKHLYEENKDICIDGQDVADIILANFNHKIKTKRQVIGALKGLGLIKSVKDLKPQQRKDWLESEIVELQHLFEDNKSADDIMSIILDKLSIKRSRKAVVDKLLELNLISDRKEVRKKSSKRGKRNTNNSDSEDNSASESEASDTEYNQDNHIDNELNSDLASSGEENEINFFNNLEAERNLDKNSVPGVESSLHSENIDVQGSSEKNKKLAKVWEEQEIMELTALFHPNQDSDNIMQILLDSLSVKRPEKAIVKKLLELRLISDKKEIKKKGRKSEQKKSNMRNSPNDNTLHAADDDSEDDLVKPASSYSRKLKAKKKLKRSVLSDSSDEDNASVVKDTGTTESNKNQKMMNRKQPKPWREEEIMELNQFFLIYKESDDVMSSILGNLTTKRTKKDLLEKMLEIGLIKDKKEVQRKSAGKAAPLKSDVNTVPAKPKKKKLSEIWGEQEVIELNQLYETYKSSNDIMTDILNSLSVKRNKQNVVEKMLELKLIQDKKEIRKKRTKKNKVKHDSSEDNDSDNDKVIGKGRNRTKKSSPKSSDDESLPLSNIVSKNNGRDSSNIFTVESDSENIIEDKTLTVSSTHVNLKLDETSSEGSLVNGNEDSGVVVSSSNESSSFRNNKRKRLLIISDDSSDEDGALNREQPVDETAPISNFSDTLEDNIVSKKKKKMRVLEDSDDSS